VETFTGKHAIAVELRVTLDDVIEGKVKKGIELFIEEPGQARRMIHPGFAQEQGRGVDRLDSLAQSSRSPLRAKRGDSGIDLVGAGGSNPRPYGCELASSEPLQ
jgi:hypothetical protein